MCIDDYGRLYKEVQLPKCFDIKEDGYIIVLYGKIKGKRDHFIKL